jgi:type IV secretion system protein TrbL
MIRRLSCVRSLGHRPAEPPRGTRVRRAAGPLLAGVALSAASLLLAAATAGAQTPSPGPPGAPDGILDGVVHTYSSASIAWLATVLPIAQRLFAVLATLELAVSGLFWALSRETLDAVAAALLRKFIVLSFLFTLLFEFPLWIPAITRSFEAAGQAASGTTAVNPSLLLDDGIAIGAHMLQAIDDAGLLTHPAGTLVAEATALIVILAYALIAVQLCLTLCEVSLVLTGGALFLGFAGFRVTAPLAEGYLLFSFQTGIKVYLLYLLTGVGTTLSGQWAALDFQLFTSAAPPTLAPQFAVMTGALVLCLLTWRTGGIATRLVHSASFHLREALH